jgi:hypothetical protein
MSLISSALYCAVVWAAVMLWLADALNPATVILALIGGVLAGMAWYEERSTTLAGKDRTR